VEAARFAKSLPRHEKDFFLFGGSFQFEIVGDWSIGEPCAQRNISRATDGLKEREFGLQKNGS
jgi:hypothetical protein